MEKRRKVRRGLRFFPNSISTCRFVIHERNSSQLRTKFQLHAFFLSNSQRSINIWRNGTSKWANIFDTFVLYIYSKGEEGSVLDFIGRDNLFLDPYFVSIGVRLPCGWHATPFLTLVTRAQNLILIKRTNNPDYGYTTRVAYDLAT